MNAKMTPLFNSNFLSILIKNTLAALLLIAGLQTANSQCANNLLTNAGFENGLQGWLSTGSPSISTTSNSGSSAALVEAGFNRVFQAMSAQAGETYTLSAFIKSTTAGGEGNIRIKFLNSGWVPIEDHWSELQITQNYNMTSELAATAPANTTYIEVSVYSDSDVDVIVDDVCLQEGVTFSGIPDLVPIVNTGNTSAENNEEIVFSIAISNNGTESGPNGGYAVYLSDDDVLSNNDLQLEQGNPSPNTLTPGQISNTQQETYIVPANNIFNGTKYIIIFVDHLDNVEESVESNNQFVFPVQISTPSGPSGCTTNLSAPGEMLCTEKSGSGVNAYFFNEASLAVTKYVINGFGDVVNIENAGQLVTDSVLVQGNQVIKKNQFLQIQYTKTIPQSVLDELPEVHAAAELTDGTFVLAGFKKQPVSNPPSGPAMNDLILVHTDSDLNLIQVQSKPISHVFNPYFNFNDFISGVYPGANGAFDVFYSSTISTLTTFKRLFVSRFSFNDPSSFNQVGKEIGSRVSEASVRIIQTPCGSYRYSGPTGYVGQKGNFFGIAFSYFDANDLSLISSKVSGSGSLDYYGSYDSWSFRASQPDSLIGSFQYRPSYDPIPPLHLAMINAAPPQLGLEVPFFNYDHAVRLGVDDILLFGKDSNGDVFVEIPTDCNAVEQLFPDITSDGPTPQNVNDYSPGDDLQYFYGAINEGNGGTTAKIAIRTWLSMDTNLDANDIGFPVFYIDGLNAGQAVGGDDTLSLPTNLAAGDYYLILELDAGDANAETDESNNVVVSNETITVIGGGCTLVCSQPYWEPNESCPGSDVALAIMPTAGGGSGNYTYEWSNGATGTLNDNLAPGTYTVTVTDTDTGCTCERSVSGGYAIVFDVALDVVQPASGATIADGEIQANWTDLFAPYSVSWSNGQTAQTNAIFENLEGLLPGNYGVTVSAGAFGCENTALVNLPADGGGDIDLELSAVANPINPDIYSNGTVEVTLNNTGNVIATGIKVRFEKPANTVYTGGNEYTSTQGTFEFSGVKNTWFVGSLPAGGSATLIVNLFILSEDEQVAYVQVVEANEQDIDSSPFNGTPPVPNEDDETIATINGNGSSCSVSANVTSVYCDDSNTPNDPSDDSYGFFVTVTGSDTGNQGWEFVGQGYAPNSNPYGTSTQIGNFFINQGSVAFTIRDKEDSACSTNITVDPPAPCSNDGGTGLTITNVECPDEYPGHGIDVTWDITIQNNSTTATAQPTELYLWNRSIQVPSKKLYGSTTIPAFAPGAIMVVSITIPSTVYFPTPGQAGYGDMFFFMGNKYLSFDANGDTEDYTEADGFPDEFCKKYNTDLEIELTPITPTVLVSQPVTFLMTVTNNGPMNAHNVEADFDFGYAALGFPIPDVSAVLSKGEFWRHDFDGGGTTPYRFFWYLPTLISGESATAEVTIAPALFVANVDYVINRTVSSGHNNDPDLSNNTDEITIPYDNSNGDIDLELTLSQSDDNPDQWSSYTVTATLTNTGGQTATGVKIQVPKPDGVVYVGGNEYSASQGSFLTFGAEEWNVGSLAAGSSATLEVNYFLTAANAPTTYAQVSAANETDADSTPGNGTPPTPNEDDEASTDSDPNQFIDLIVTDLTVPASGARGSLIEYSYKIKNTGTVDAAIPDQLFGYTYLTSDNAIVVGDTVIQLFYAPSGVVIPAGGSYDVTQYFTIEPQIAVGDYFIYVQMNSSGIVPESDGSNNYSALVPFEVTNSPLQGVDLEAGSFSANISLFAGEQYFYYEFTAQSLGIDLPDDQEYISAGFYVSTDDVLSADDRFIRQVELVDIGFNNSYFNSADLFYVDPPLLGGNYYLIAKVDDADIYSETDENNNTTAISTTIEGVNAPDLTLMDLNIQNPAVQAGQVLNYDVDISNIGTEDATGDFTVKAWISTDNFFSNDDIQDGIIPTGNYAAGLTVADVTGSSTIPANLPNGDYYLILRVDADQDIVESSEGNNLITAPFTVTDGNQNTCTGNLLQNPGFEDGEVAWSFDGAITYNNNFANFCMIGQLLGHLQGRNLAIMQTVPATAGKEYDLICQAGAWEYTSQLGGAIGMHFKNSNGAILATTELIINGPGWSSTPIIDGNGCSYYAVSLSGIAPVGTSSVEVFAETNSWPFPTGAAGLYVDEFCLTEKTSGGDIDLSLSMSATDMNPSDYSDTEITLTITNDGTETATDIVVAFPKPSGVVYTGGNEWTATQGNFVPFGNEEWAVGDLPAGGSASITVSYFTLTENTLTPYAQAVAVNETDGDSSPNNGTCCTPNEDDEAALVLNGFAGGGGSNNFKIFNDRQRMAFDKIYPMPAKYWVTMDVYSKENQSAIFAFYDQQGRSVYRMEVELEEGRNEIGLDISAWRSGNYNVIGYGNGTPAYGRLVKVWE